MDRNLEETILRNRLENASSYAGDILKAHAVAGVPVDPFAIAAAQEPLLTTACDDFGDRFDGRIEYHRRHARFLLFVNTKYDAATPGDHHPRTRFSLGHELGHFFLEAHHAYLRRGGKPHGSRSEFASDRVVEREADSFAAGLLMPHTHLRPIVNAGELTVARLEQIGERFRTSLVSTAIQAVQCSDFPHAVVAIREGRRGWSAQAPCLVDAGCYPGPKGKLASRGAEEQWRMFSAGAGQRVSREGVAGDWFRTYARDDLAILPVYEDYIPLPVMNTLLVLLSIPEELLHPEHD